MAYRGNPSLPAEIQQRINATFEQALRSAKQGNRREAQLGCDFILKLDSDFEPAQILADRLRQAQASPASGDDLGERIKALAASGEHAQVVELAGRHPERVRADAELSRLATEAQEKLSVDKLIARLTERAQQKVLDGDFEGCEALLDKARSVAPDDARVHRVAGMLEAQRPAARAAVAPPPLPDDDPLSGFDLDLDEGIFEGALEPPDASGSEAALGGSTFAAPADAGPPPEEASFPSAAPTSDPVTLPADDPLAGFAFDAPDSASDAASDEAFSDRDVETLFDSFADAGAAADTGASTGATDAPADLSSFGVNLDEELDDDLDFSLGGLDDGGSAQIAPPAGLAGREDTPGSAFGAREDDAAAEPPSGDRVSGLLDEGQAAFDIGDFQGAIDAWSRIFLIDIDHEEASRRIERARKLKAEVERQVEEILHEGLSAYEAGDLEAARDPFERVLELHPGHAVASEYLERIEAGEMPETVRRSDTLDASAVAGPPPEDPVLQEEILVPPDPDAVSPPPPPPPATASKRGGIGAPSRRFLLVGAASLLIFAALAAFLFVNWDRFFPNREAEPIAAAGAESPLDKARKLAAGGRTRLAIAQLERVPTTSPHYAAAQELIAELESAAPALDETALAAGEAATEESAPAREELIAEARRELAEGSPLRAHDLLGQAAAIAPLDADEGELEAEVRRQLEPFETELQLYSDGDWELALPGLWRLHLAEPGNRDAKRLLVNSYFNLGVRQLQRNEISEAAKSFAEVLELEPGDAEAERHRRFAETYSEQPPDLLFRIYVKYLPFR